MRIGIVGMPGAGKTTLFRLLTGVAPSRKQDASIGMARVPDARIDLLSKMYQPKKTTYAQLEVVDLAGRASSGSTFDDFSSNKRGIARGLTLLINHMRNVDALVNVVRTFDSLELGEPNPLADASALTDELILADMAIAEARIERLNSSRKRTEEEDKELALMERLDEEFGAGRSLRDIQLEPEEAAGLRGYGLLSVKPIVVVANMSEEQFREGKFPRDSQLQEYCCERSIPLIRLAAEIEAEIAELDSDDKDLFMAAYGIEVSGIEQVSRAVYDSLGLVSFFTVGEDEVRAWPIENGTTAKRAAGKIHSDIERGFIRAEVVACDDLMSAGSLADARSAGSVRLEGKEYVMADGDIVNFRFSPAH
ncbi:MAG TPA: DUF933 domain-containing protein [Bacillota bacterium]|jgi:GTP-binding protein YchF|nr:DUF933 domain-containing protein [Bacillota bacterium]HPZ12640.1 DUF933 domain-containing protein [Bacillota bacterium]